MVTYAFEKTRQCIVHMRKDLFSYYKLMVIASHYKNIIVLRGIQVTIYNWNRSGKELSSNPSFSSPLPSTNHFDNQKSSADLQVPV